VQAREPAGKFQRIILIPPPRPGNRHAPPRANRLISAPARTGLARLSPRVLR